MLLKIGKLTIKFLHLLDLYKLAISLFVIIKKKGRPFTSIMTKVSINLICASLYFQIKTCTFSKHINLLLYAWFQIIIHIISIITITHHAQNVKSSNMIQTYIFKIFITIFMYDNEVFMIPNIKSIFFKYLSLYFDHDTNIHDIKSIFIILYFSNNS